MDEAIHYWHTVQLSMFTDWIVAFIGILTLVVLSGQLYYLHRAYIDDHTRRKKQATLEYFQTHTTEASILRSEIIEIIPNLKRGEPLSLENVSEESITKIIPYLNKLEYLAVGVNEGVFDFQTMNRLAGVRLVRIYKTFQPYIENRRNEIDYPTLYSDFVNLAKKIMEVRGIDG